MVLINDWKNQKLNYCRYTAYILLRSTTLYSLKRFIGPQLFQQFFAKEIRRLWSSYLSPEKLLAPTVSKSSNRQFFTDEKCRSMNPESFIIIICFDVNLACNISIFTPSISMILMKFMVKFFDKTGFEFSCMVAASAASKHHGRSRGQVICREFRRWRCKYGRIFHKGLCLLAQWMQCSAANFSTCSKYVGLCRVGSETIPYCSKKSMPVTLACAFFILSIFINSM